jgi:RND family efflux transporter MFP subunit
MKEHNMKTKIWVIPALLIAIAAGCEPSQQKKPAVSTVIHISVQPVEMTEYRIPVRTTGLLETTTQVKLSFKTGGIIDQLEVKEGTSVSRGEVLARLDLSEIRAQVNQANIGYDMASRDLARAKNLYNDSVVTLEQYQNARSAFDLAKAKKQIADFNLKHSQIRAPSEGKIMKILVESNEMIGPGHPAILFGSTEGDWVVRSQLTDKDIVRLSLGDSGVVTMDAFPGITFESEVTELATVADPVTGTYEAELRILTSHPQFRTGFISRVRIFPAGSSRSLIVPMESLLEANDRDAHVFVYVNGTVTRKRVRLGPIVGNAAVITDGLTEGELVVTRGAKYLRVGSEVNLVDPPENDTP